MPPTPSLHAADPEFSGVERSDRELDAQREERLAKWADVERELPTDLSDRNARARWAEAREHFSGTVGPIPASRADRRVLGDLRDRHRGERIFVLGTGPSLDDTPLHLLAGEYTFGVDRLYQIFDRIRWRPTFYAAVDVGSAAECAVDLNALTGMRFFFPETLRGMLRDGDDVTWFWEDPSRGSAHRRPAVDASLGIRPAGSATGTAIQLAIHMGFDPIYLLGCDASDTVPEISTREGEELQRCRDDAERAGHRIFDASVDGGFDVLERVAIRSLFRHDPPTRMATRDPVSRRRHGVPGSGRADVAPTVLVTALLDRDQPGLALAIGAGTGNSLAPFAAAGWEVRAFEPEPSTHDDLVAALPPQWPVIVDPRALGCVDTDAEIFRSPSGGGCFVQRDGSTQPSATVKVVTPATAFAALRSRRPDIVLISAAGWEQEILRAYPFDSARPDAMVVDVDDRSTAQLGFRGCDLAKALEKQGYDVFGLEYRLAGPNELRQAVCEVVEHEGELTHLLALPPGLATVQTIECCRRAVLAARHEDVATAALRAAPQAAAQRARQPDDEALRARLDALQASMSWRLGHGMVVTAKRIVRPARRLVVAPRRVIRRGRARLGGGS